MGNLGYYFLWGITCLMHLFPLRAHYVVADIIYLSLYYVAGYRKKIVFENLTNAFPEKPATEIKAIARKFYRHLSDMSIETLYFAHIPKKEVLKRIRFKNIEEVNQYHKNGQSCVGVLAHYANWEWLCAFTIHSPYTYYHFYKPLHSKTWNRFLFKMRTRWGALLTHKDKAYRLLIGDHLQGKINCSGFVSDQTPKDTEIQYRTTFLNQDTPVFLGAEKVAKKTNSPVIFCHLDKVKRGYYEVKITTLIKEPVATEPFEITETHTRFLEKIIQQRPELWLWSHRRWKYKKQKPKAWQGQTQQ